MNMPGPLREFVKNLRETRSKETFGSLTCLGLCM